MNTTISYSVTKIQAYILMATGLCWMAAGLYLGHEPLTLAWRAAAGALAMMIAAGYLLRLAARIIAERLQELETAQQAAQSSTSPETTS